MHEIIAWRFVTLNGPHHGVIRTISNGIADTGFLAFKLEPKFALGTRKITGLRVMGEPAEFGRRTIGTVKVMLTPGFSNNPRALGAAGVIGAEFAGHGEVHEKI